jgi:hypothetical protein
MREDSQNHWNVGKKSRLAIRIDKMDAKSLTFRGTIQIISG